MNAVWAVGASSRFEACVERPIVIDASKSREFSNGVLTFIPGVYEQFRPSSESDAILTITSDHPPVSTPEPGAGLLLRPDSSVLSLSGVQPRIQGAELVAQAFRPEDFRLRLRPRNNATKSAQIREIVCANLSRALR